MEPIQIKTIIEAVLFVADQPITVARLRGILGRDAEGHDLEQIVRDIGEEYTRRKAPMELRQVAGGWQFATVAEYAPWIRKYYKGKTTLKLSPSALETLSIIAYKQPLTRADMEQIRGVEVSGVLETMLERKLIKIVGRKETLGRPLLYGTTAEFLRHFGLSHLSELPSIDELTPPAVETNPDDQTVIEIGVEEPPVMEEAPQETETPVDAPEPGSGE